MSASSPILYVEDSDHDYNIALRSFKKANFGNEIIRCEDGDEAIEYLTNSKLEKNSIPSLILLDLNLPGTTGIEVLQEIKSHDTLKVIPVIILTTSDNEDDITKCYNNGANSYLKKPVKASDLVIAFERMKEYLIEINVLPKA